jgi:transposase
VSAASAGTPSIADIGCSGSRQRELILNYFRAQKLLSSGVVEGLNNKAQVTMRRSYGFRTFRVLELALYHSLGKLP